MMWDEIEPKKLFGLKTRPWMVSHPGRSKAGQGARQGKGATAFLQEVVVWSLLHRYPSLRSPAFHTEIEAY